MAPEHRIDLFTSVHKGVRKLLFSTATQVAATDFADATAAAATIAQVGDVLTFLAEHAHHEDQLIFPLVGAHDAIFGVALARDHMRLDDVQQELQDLAARRARRPASPVVYGRMLTSLFDGLVAEHLLHMAREEHDGNAILWRHHADEDLLAVRGRILSAMSPERARAWRQLILAALNPAERLLLTQPSAPPPSSTHVTDGPRA